MPSCRTVLIGIGGIVAGGGALVGTGAFTTVQAERTVNVETTGDASAFLALEAAGGPNSEYIDTTGDTIVIDITSTQAGGQGLNQNAITNIRNIVQVTNNGTQDVTELTLEFTNTPSNVDPNVTFDFLVDEGSDSVDLDHSSGGVDILTDSSGISDSLSTGNSITFGLGIDLINGGNDNNNLPQDGTYDLSITAETGGGGQGNGPGNSQGNGPGGNN